MRQLRRATFFAPYHNAIASLLDHRAGTHQPTALLAIHSFTPDYPGQERPWHVDFAYNRDRQLAGLLLDAMAKQSDLTIGDNLPYGVDDESDFTIPIHGERRGLPSVLIEIRQDLLSTPAGIKSWVDRLTELLTESRQSIERLALAATRRKD
jgi:predicted N-formylglutamate amidohydrolase